MTASVAVYANSLGGKFVYDDRPIIAQNPLVHGDAPIADVFATSYWQRGDRATPDAPRQGGLYRPLTILSYRLNWRLGGGDPFSFHLINVLLHGAVSVLLFLLLARFGFSVDASGIGALSFAVLPVHVEAVAWTVGRAEILGAFFVLSAWLAIHEARSPARICAGLTFYGLALLSKESAAPFPAVLILGEFFRRRTTPKQLLRERAPVWSAAFGVLSAYLLWRREILGASFFVGRPYFPTQSRLTVLLTMARFFLKAWVWPMLTGTGLCADHSRPGFPDASSSDIGAWVALFVAGALFSWAFVAFSRKRSPAAFSMVVLAVFAAPLSNLLVPMEIIGAERIMYLPSVSMGALLAAAWDARIRFARVADRAAPFLAAVLLLWWGGMSIARNRVWRDDASLFKATAEVMPSNPRVLTGLGMIADLKGDRIVAREFYRRALQVDPSHSQAAYNMGKSYFEEGDRRSAEAWFKGLETRSGPDKDVLCFLGLIAERDRRYDIAASYYIRTLELDPWHLEARRNLGLLLFRRGRSEDAARQLRSYLDAGPPAADAAEISEFLRRISVRSGVSSEGLGQSR